MEQTKELPRWDLTDLYKGTDDPTLTGDLGNLLDRARSFASQWQGKVASGTLSSEQLLSALNDYESLVRQATKIGSFASLHYSTDTTDPDRGALLQKVREQSSLVSTQLLFFTLELGRLEESKLNTYLESALLTPYHHYLSIQKDIAKHNLSQAEETILEETANSRGRAFRRLFTETVSRMKFELEIDGQTKTLTQSELLAYNYHPDRKLREAASKSLAVTLERNAPTLTFITNTLLAEKEVMDRLRSFEAPESSMHLSNELPMKAVSTMVDVCVKNFSIVEDYYNLKRELLGLESLSHFDRYAPLKASEENIAYDKACQIVLEAYRDFSEKLHQLALPFFEKNWIDVPVSPGKRGGAFCAGVSPDHHPYILLNYTDKPRDVMTLAHELGHGLHDCLASEHHILDYHPVLPLAETASTFGEMLTFEKLYSELDNDEERLSLLCGKLEDTFATVFRQISMFRFERRIHEARRTEGELKTERLNELWQECMGEMFGDSLSLGDEHKWTWLYIPHIVQTPFYVYAYAFGELLVLSLYARYQSEGEEFIDKYLELLKAGGSQSPQTILAKLNIDIEDPNFWQAGCDLIATNLDKAKSLYQKTQG